MSKNFRVVLVKNDEDFHFAVFEKETELFVRLNEFEEDAENYQDFLESGGAFAGFTPKFMVEDLNDGKLLTIG